MNRTVSPMSVLVMFIVMFLFLVELSLFKFSLDWNAIYTILFYLLAMFILIGISSKYLDDGFLDTGVWIMVLAFSLRIFWVVYAYQWSMDNLGIGTYRLGDVNFYDRSAWALAQSAWDSGSFMKYCSIPNPGYVYFLGFIYRIFGHNISLAVALNSFIGCIISIIMYRLAQVIYDKEFVSRLTYILCLFFPPLIYYQVLLYKETLLILFLILIAWNLIRLLSVPSVRVLKNWYFIFQIGLLLGLVYIFRFQLFFPVLALIGWVFFMYKLKTKRQRIKFLLFIFLLIFITAGYLQATPLWKNSVSEFKDLFHNTGNVEEYVKNHPESFFRFTSGGLLKKWYFIPLAVLFTLIQPFPPWREGLRVLLNWPWIFLMPLSLQGAVSFLRRNVMHRVTVFLVVILLMACVLGYGGSNIRYRISFMPLVLMFTAVGCYRYVYKDKRSFLYFWITAYLLGCFLYLVLRGF